MCFRFPCMRPPPARRLRAASRGACLERVPAAGNCCSSCVAGLFSERASDGCRARPSPDSALSKTVRWRGRGMHARQNAKKIPVPPVTQWIGCLFFTGALKFLNAISERTIRIPFASVARFVTNRAGDEHLLCVHFSYANGV